MKLKSIIIILLSVILISGCDKTIDSTPTRTIESFFSKYQKIDDEVIRQLELSLDTKPEYSDDNKKEYESLMIKQYQNLSYKIIDEKQKNNSATVDVEIEVYDYKTSITKANEYYSSHKEELKGESLISYQIKKMKDVNDRSIYQITFNLYKDEKGNWKIDNINDIDKQKINGLY